MKPKTTVRKSPGVVRRPPGKQQSTSGRLNVELGQKDILKFKSLVYKNGDNLKKVLSEFVEKYNSTNGKPYGKIK